MDTRFFVPEVGTTLDVEYSERGRREREVLIAGNFQSGDNQRAAKRYLRAVATNLNAATSDDDMRRIITEAEQAIRDAESAERFHEDVAFPR